MCGFVAILQDHPVDSPSARRALNALTHRGPDAGGEWFDQGIFLGHRRLSIIDLNTGGQPMHSTDGRYVIVFNGEIYNFPDLRQELLQTGAKFNTQSDTEVILEGYKRWGTEVVRRLHGMFAFVIWDRSQKTAFAARDRLGIKPLCWAMHRGSLILCSTLEPFRVLLGADSEIDLTALRDLMTYDYIPVPRTIFKGVRKLESGSWLQWSAGACEPTTGR
jgi:asparagine synthase (glutamine-hydrolysing)